MGPQGKQEGRAGNQGQAPYVSKGDRSCKVCVTEIPEAAGDGAEFWGVVGVFTLLHSMGS